MYLCGSIVLQLGRKLDTRYTGVADHPVDIQLCWLWQAVQLLEMRHLLSLPPQRPGASSVPFWRVL